MSAEPIFEWPDAHTRDLNRRGTRVKVYRMGQCKVVARREKNGARLWRLTISHPARRPTLDEIKTARDGLVPDDRCMVILPAEQDHVVEVCEVTDTEASGRRCI